MLGKLKKRRVVVRLTRQEIADAHKLHRGFWPALSPRRPGGGAQRSAGIAISADGRTLVAVDDAQPSLLRLGRTYRCTRTRRSRVLSRLSVAR
jgi:hypothetical protein